MKMEPKESNRVALKEHSRLMLVLAAYLLTSMLLVAFSYYPNGRVWGFNLLAFFANSIRVVAIPVMLLISFIAGMFAYKQSPSTSLAPAGESRHLLLWEAIVLTIFVVSFYLFRATSYFDGDGYIALANLTEGTNFIKFQDFGAMVAQISLYKFLGSGGEDTAVRVFQWISYLSGAAYLLIVTLAAHQMLRRAEDRLLFVLGMATGGYALMFFGYVENYPLLLVVVSLYLYVGILVIQRDLSPWYLVLTNLLTIFIHILGAVFLPSTLYLLFRGSHAQKWLSKRSSALKSALGLVMLIAVLACFVVLVRSSYVFRFAFLPVFPDRFTANGYTIFSGKHLLDIVNLLFLLSPGLLILLAGASFRNSKRSKISDLLRFLGLAAVCGAIAVLIFDPKLGMPRDWDLFGFVGVPINFLLLTLVLNSEEAKRAGRVAVVLTVALSMVFLGARVAAKRTDQIAIDRLNSYTPLDPIRNNKNGLFISKYYFSKGDSLRGYQEDSLWQRSNRDIIMVAYGKALFDSGKVVQAMSAYRQAIAYDPFEPLPYSNLGHCFIQIGDLDSAEQYLQIAQGLRPSDPMVLANLGFVDYQKGDRRGAERLWLEAAQEDSTKLLPELYLMQLYQTERNKEGYLKYLLRVVEYPDAPPVDLVTGAKYFYQKNDFDKARRLLLRARMNGLDSTRYLQVLDQYPKLIENPQNK